MISEKCCILEKSRKNLVKFGENSAKFWQNLRNFGKKQQKIQQFLTKILRLESSRCHVGMSGQDARGGRVVPYHGWILDVQDVAALLCRRLGRAWVALLRVYFFVDYTCNLGRIDYRAYLGDGFPRPRIRRDTAENVDLAGFFEGTPRRTRPTESDNSDASPDSDASDD